MDTEVRVLPNPRGRRQRSQPKFSFHADQFFGASLIGCVAWNSAASGFEGATKSVAVKAVSASLG